jgi:acyl-CoA dehydrogenase
MRTVLNADHELFRDQFRRFLEEHVVPHHRQWERDGIVPRDLYRKAGEHGFLCTMMPEEYGGAGVDYGFSAVVIEEIARVNVTGVGFTMHSDVLAPYILDYGSEEAKRRWLPKMAAGEIIGALAMTEPGIGSDLASVRTTARREGDEYVINGQKTFITNGVNCGLVVVVCKTDPQAGRKGVSLIVVEEGAAGFTKGRKLEKIGLHAQDTAELFFEDVRVPVSHRLGEENRGFYYLMHQLPQERIAIGVRAAASIESLLDQTIEYVKNRNAFGKPVFEFQNTKFKLAEIKAEAAMLRAFVDDCLAQHMRGELTAERAAMVKLVSSDMQNRLLDEMLQLHGGYGFMSEYMIGRAWVDARVMRIYAGSNEIMKEIIGRGL